MSQPTQWLFGYGSLIWRPDFDYLQSERATLKGFTRRFWQGSHDHRGTPTDPGRVVTLVPEVSGACIGLAFEIESQVADDILQRLDYREKNGYQRANVNVEFGDGKKVRALTYYATAENHAYFGPASDQEILRQIARCVGPSGRNIDYLAELHQALIKLEAEDEHVAALYRLGAQEGLFGR